MIGSKEDFNFRELHHQILILTNDPKNVMVAATQFPSVPGDNALLLYGYIDHEAGISFEVLCMAQILPGRPAVFREGSSTTSYKIRYDSISGTLMNTMNEPEFMNYWQKIQMINNSYKASLVAEKFREFSSLDPSRHPQFPDDIIIWFLSNNQKPEGIWGRIESYDGRYVTAVLLDEPWGNFGYHRGDQVPFDHMEMNGELKAVAVW